jgi:hypothetical protein
MVAKNKNSRRVDPIAADHRSAISGFLSAHHNLSGGIKLLDGVSSWC